MKAGKGQYLKLLKSLLNYESPLECRLQGSKCGSSTERLHFGDSSHGVLPAKQLWVLPQVNGDSGSWWQKDCGMPFPDILRWKQTWHLHQQQKRTPQRDQLVPTILPAWGFVNLCCCLLIIIPRPLTHLVRSHCSEPVKVNHQVKWQSLLC